MTASAFAENPGLARDSPRSPFLDGKEELLQEPSSARSLSRSASGRLPSLFRQVSAHDITLAELDGEGAAQDGSESSSLPGTPRRALLRLTSRAQSFSLEPVPEAEALAVVAPGTPSEASATAEELAVSEPMTAEETRQSVFFLDGAEASTEEFARHAIVAEELDDNFYVYDMSVIQKNYAAWAEALPRVQPFYAVKCNPDASMLAVLAALGTGFDCASQGEIEKVLSLGVSPDRIVYAHPCKPPRQIRFAAENGINLTTVDTASELHKIAQLHPGCGLLIRIRADDITAVCQLGNKFGVEVDEEAELLQIAKELGLDVRGVSFHVGSGAKDPAAFRLAIEHARKVFDLGKELGYEMDVLDLGGGFTGGSLQNVRDVINTTLDECFPADGNVRIIAEPGRYFAEPAATYFCCVIGYRERKPKNGAEQEMHYFLSDGIYGSMNCILYDHIKLDPKPFRSPLLPEVSPEEDAHTIKSTFFGPTCDGLDTFCPDVRLPRLRNGDFVAFPRFGAYTLAGATNFNGFEIVGAKCFYFYAN